MWESEMPKLLRAVEAHDIKLIFVTSRQATERLNKISNSRYACDWVPEAVRGGEVSFQTDVRASDRCYPVWKTLAANIMIGSKGSVVIRESFTDTNPRRASRSSRRAPEFLDGLADAKISICVPSAITDPERSGDISTMTWRYLESMASKCLVLGRAPLEMKELFDYDPIIEIDLNRPGEQLLELLTDLPRYQELIEKNYDHVRRHHQWRNRIAAMREYFADFEKRYLMDE